MTVDLKSRWMPPSPHREKLIEELRAERDAGEKAAVEAAQEAEAAAWLEARRSSEGVALSSAPPRQLSVQSLRSAKAVLALAIIVAALIVLAPRTSPGCIPGN